MWKKCGNPFSTTLISEPEGPSNSEDMFLDQINSLSHGVQAGQSHSLEDLFEQSTISIQSNVRLPSRHCTLPTFAQGEQIDAEMAHFFDNNTSIQSNKHVPPDIRNGLGNRESCKNLNALEQFVLEQYTLLMCGGNLYLYEPPCWQLLDEREAVTKIRELLMQHQDLQDYVTASDCREIYRSLLTNPTLEKYSSLESPTTLLNCIDGTLDLETLRITSHQSSDYFFSYVDCKCIDILDPPMDGNVFEAFAENISGGDESVRTQLLELTILALTGLDLKYFYAMIGPSHTGKTQFGRFLEELVGRENVESIRGIGDFGDRWTIGSLAGKKLATCLDLPDTALPAVAVGAIKQFVGDDPVKGEKKYQNSFTFYKKPLLLLAGNHPIRIKNAHQEQAFLNRLVTIPFFNPVSECDMVQKLYEELLYEAPYIIHHAIDAFQQLRERNYAATRSAIAKEYAPQDSSQALRDLAEFIDDCIVVKYKNLVSTQALYNAYVQYAEDNHFSFTSMNAFSKAFVEAVKQKLPDTQLVKCVPPESKRGYRNITLLYPYGV